MANPIDELDMLLNGRGSRAVGDARRWLFKSDDDVPLSDLQTALVKSGLAAPIIDRPRGLYQDPYNVTDWGGWRQRPTSVSYATLAQMSLMCAPIAAVVQIRTNQVGQFCRPQKGRYDKGYRIIARDREAAKRAMTPAEAKEAETIERMLETTAVLLPGEKPAYRESFKTFTKKSVADILRYDAWAIEIQRDSRGRPSRFGVLDGATIMPTVVDYDRLSVEDHRTLISHVQVWEQQVVAEFTRDQLAYHIMTPRSDLRSTGFGLSPVEQVIRLTTAWLYGFDYNQNFFKQGSAIKGLINIKGTIPDRQMRAFRRMWYSMVSGVQNAWRTPILNADDVQWMSMHTANREMEFSAWMDWLTKLITAIFGVDPVEINFQFGNTGQSSTLSEGNNEEKTVESKDKGLRPLVEHVQDAVTAMVQDINPDFEFSFVGLDADAENREKDGIAKEVKSISTVNEGRARVGLGPLPGERGDVILDAVWQTWVAAKEQPQQPVGPDGQPVAGAPPGTPPGAAPDDDDEETGLMDGSDNPPDEDEEDDDLLSAINTDDEDDEEDDLLAASMSGIGRALNDTLRKSKVIITGNTRPKLSYE